MQSHEQSIMLGQTPPPIDTTRTAATETPIASTVVTSSSALADVPPALRHTLVAESVRDDTAALCAIARVEDVDMKRPLAQFGLDELGAEMLRCSIESLLDITLPARLKLHEVSAHTVASWALYRWSATYAPASVTALH